jgi:hypothetical protein
MTTSILVVIVRDSFLVLLRYVPQRETPLRFSPVLWLSGPLLFLQGVAGSSCHSSGFRRRAPIIAFAASIDRK